MRVIAAALAVVLSATTMAQSRNPALAGLDAELEGRKFVTRIPVGIHYTYFFQGGSRSQQFRQWMQRGVDTRVSSDGRITYVAVGMHYPVQPPGLQLTNTNEEFIEPEAMVPPRACSWVLGAGYDSACRSTGTSTAIPPGTKVTVGRLRWRSDRVSLELMVGLGEPTITFMFGKDFQSLATRESILSVVSRALVLEDFEHLQRVNAEYVDLMGQLDAARIAYASAVDAERLKNGEALMLRLKALVQNRSAREQLTRGGSVNESAQYTKEVADLEAVLSALRADREANLSRQREEARIARIAEIGSILGRKDQQIDSVLASVQARKPSGLAQWREQQATLAQVQQLLTEKAPLLDERETLGQARSAEDVARLARQKQRLESSRANLTSERAALERMQVDEDYHALERRRVELLDAYTKSFGTPQERGALQSLIGHLGRMLENRKAAADLGSPTARDQVKQLEAEIEKLSRR